MKRLILIALALALLAIPLVGSPVCAEGNPTVTAVPNETDVMEGEIVGVPIVLTGLVDHNFDSASFSVLFNPTELELTDVLDGLVMDGEFVGTAVPVTWNLLPSGDRCNILSNVTGVASINSEVQLAILVFTAITGWGSAIGFEESSLVLSNNLGERITPVTVVEGTINIRVAGDANLDGTINAQDITSIERQVVGLDEETVTADLNADNEVNALDVTLVERKIAGLD